MKRELGALRPILTFNYFDKEYLEDLTPEMLKDFTTVNNRLGGSSQK